MVVTDPGNSGFNAHILHGPGDPPDDLGRLPELVAKGPAADPLITIQQDKVRRPAGRRRHAAALRGPGR